MISKSSNFLIYFDLDLPYRNNYSYVYPHLLTYYIKTSATNSYFYGNRLGIALNVFILRMGVTYLF